MADNKNGSLCIWTSVTEYSTSDVSFTATVGDLIEKLRQYDPDTPIYYRTSGYKGTGLYGPVDAEYDIDYDEEE